MHIINSTLFKKIRMMEHHLVIHSTNYCLFSEKKTNLTIYNIKSLYLYGK